MIPVLPEVARIQIICQTLLVPKAVQFSYYGSGGNSEANVSFECLDDADLIATDNVVEQNAIHDESVRIAIWFDQGDDESIFLELGHKVQRMGIEWVVIDVLGHRLGTSGCSGGTGCSRSFFHA